MLLNINIHKGSMVIAVKNCSILNYDGIGYDFLACPRVIISGIFDIIDKNPNPNSNNPSK